MNIFKTTILTLTGMALLASAGCSKKETGTSLEGNPFKEVSSLPFGAPDFSKITDADYLPAIKAGIEQQREEIRAIVESDEPATFENVILAYEKSGRLLDRATNAFFAVSGADGTDAITKVEAEVIPLLTSWGDEITFNDRLFAKIKTVYDNELNALQGEDKKLLEEIYDGFVRSGANLDAEQKKELEKINARIAVLEQTFGKRLPEAVNNSLIWISSEEELAGLTPDAIEQLKHNAEANGSKAPYAVILTNTTQQPIVASLENRAVREQIYNASIHRTDQDSKYNTYPIVAELAKLRAKKGEILGFANYADYSLSNSMAKNSENVMNFLNSLIDNFLPKLETEMKEIEKYAQRTMGSDFSLRPYDIPYYSAQMKKEHFSISEEDVKPYFQVDSVLENGVFYAATRAYGITFEERFDLPTYHKDMRVFTVKDKDGSEMGLFYFDPFARPTKRGGAWMSALQKQSRFYDTKPIIYNVLNIVKAPEGQPTFCTWDNVTTLFHEFGHALHGLLSDCKYNSLSGTAVYRDFVEMPSQFNEYFATVPEVFDHYAKHYETGEPMPAALKANMLNSVLYLPAYSLAENLAASYLDMAWHLSSSEQVASEAEAPDFEAHAFEQSRLSLPQIAPRYRSTYFNHVWGGGYAAGYYSYVWSEVLTANVMDYFTAHGSLNPEVGQAFRDKILSKGNTVDLSQAFTDFTGLAEPDAAALLPARGIK